MPLWKKMPKKSVPLYLNLFRDVISGFVYQIQNDTFQNWPYNKRYHTPECPLAYNTSSSIPDINCPGCKLHPETPISKLPAADQVFLNFCSKYDVLVVYHKAGLGCKQYQKYDHYHCFATGFNNLRSHRAFTDLVEVYKKTYGEHRFLPTITVKHPDGMAKYLAKSPRYIVRQPRPTNPTLNNFATKIFNIASEPTRPPTKEIQPPPTATTDPHTRKCDIRYEHTEPLTARPVDDLTPPTDPIHKPRETTKNLQFLLGIIRKSGAKSPVDITRFIHTNATNEQRRIWYMLYAATGYDSSIKKAFDLDRTLSQNSTFEELMDQAAKVIWNEKHYLSVDDSVMLIEKWIDFHNFNKDVFLTDLFNTLTKSLPKKNTFILQGPPNSGKSWLIRSLLPIMRYYGEVTPGVNYNFMYQDCINTNAILFEEPLIRPEAAEQFKLIAEGAPTKVNIKMRPAESLARTPVMITTNTPIWKYCSPNKKAFQARCHQYDTIKPAPFLKAVHKTLNPTAWNTIFHDQLHQDMWKAIDAIENPQEDMSQDAQRTSPMIITDSPSSQTQPWKLPENLPMETDSNISVSELFKTWNTQDLLAGSPSTDDEPPKKKFKLSPGNTMRYADVSEDSN